MAVTNAALVELAIMVLWHGDEAQAQDLLEQPLAAGNAPAEDLRQTLLNNQANAFTPQPPHCR